MMSAMKSRGEAEGGEEPKADDLEIVSIGSLYRGPWEKKYWSCSRGKDRYPYPVGYHAVRFHDGNKCRVEIHEASKGPLFVITSADGHSCSGQTPTIAWEKFQKKGVPRMRIWHGKRFSCKIDGVEFFGFKNPFVQRLLRELVADVNGTAELSLPSPSYSNGAPVTEQETECKDLCPHPDLLAFLPKPLNTRKRNRRREKIVKKLEGAASSDISKSETLKDIKVTYSRKKRQKNSKITQSMVCPAPKEDVVVKESQEKLPKTANASHVFEACESLKAAGEGSTPSSLVDFSSACGREAGASQEHKQDNSEICRSSATAEDIKLDRLHAEETDPLSSSAPMERINEEAAVMKDSVGITDSDAVLFVNDTLDELPEDEPTAAHMDRTEGFVAESPVEEELDTHYSGGSSEKSEFDSIGQEIAKSMMTVLLPQAIPLLKKSSKKKRERKGKTSSVENSSNNIKSGENDNIDNFVNVSSPGTVNKENVPAQDGDIDCAARYSENMDNAASESKGNHQHAHQASHWDLLEDLKTCEMTNIVYQDKWHAPSDEKLRENDSNASACLMPFQGHELNSERSDQPYASVDFDPKSSGMHHEEQVLKFVSINAEANGVNDANVQDAKADEELRDADDGNSSHIPRAMVLREKYEAPLSESIVHRNSGNDYLLEEDYVDGNLMSNGVFEVCSNEQTNHSRSNAGEPMLDGQRNISSRKNPAVNGMLKLNVVPTASNVEKSKPCADVGLDVKITSLTAEEDRLVSLCKLNGDVNLYNELKGILQLLGCYSHPLPILSVILRQYGNVAYLCVQCGLLLDEERTLFLYKLLTEELGTGSPSFIGHTSVLPPISKPCFGGIMPERMWFQLSPDGKSLILLGNVKTPYCRERRISCSCSTCASVSFDDYTIRIVQVNIGYVTEVVNLKAVDKLLSILVCEPNHLVATGESGRLHSWVMNSTWSGQVEAFDLPTHGCISSCIMSLKKVPKHASLVVGYNGFGEFTLWDISRRISLAKFDSPGTLVHDFLPISSLSLRRKGAACSKLDVDERINEIMAETRRTFQEVDGSHGSSIQLEEAGVWLLVSAVSGAEDDDLRNASEVDSVARWRLALLAKNAMILGNPLDSRAAVIATLSGHGVIGTHDGLVYLWELSTGNKLGILCRFKGNGVSCIATDDSTSSILAVCGNNGELMLYLRPTRGGPGCIQRVTRM